MPVGRKKPITTLKHLLCRKYSIQKVTQFSQRNNVLGAVASGINGFLWRDSCVSSTHENRPIKEHQSLSAPRNI
jgi:hypothetical protein